MIIRNMPFAEYLAHPAASNSFLKLLDKAPELAKARLDGTYKDEDTKDKLIGRVTHCMSLERDEFSSRYAIEPVVNRRTNEGKDIIKRFREENSGKECISQEIVDASIGMSEAVKRHKKASQLLNTAEFEVSMFAEIDGVECKIRIDINRDDGIITDLKTCQDASEFAFANHAARLGYPVAAAMYWDVYEANGFNPTDYVWIAVEKKPPHLVATHYALMRDIEIGRDIYRERLATLKRCRETNEWPGIGEGLIQPLSMPAWWRKKQIGEINEY